MKELKKIDLPIGVDVEYAVNLLLEEKAKGNHAYCKFNDNIFYSDDVTMESAYIQECGCTKEELEKQQQEDLEEVKRIMEEERKKALELVPYYIEKGKEYIYPFRHEDWERFVKVDANGMYCGFITNNALEIMDLINEGKSLEEQVNKLNNQDHSGWSRFLTRYTVLEFSKNGIPFYKATSYRELDEDELKEISSILQENDLRKDGVVKQRTKNL